MAPESRLALESGPDRFLGELFAICVISSVAGFLIAPAAVPLKIAGIATTLLSIPLMLNHYRKLNRGEILVIADGRLKWRDGSQQWHEGTIRQPAWSVNRYAIIRIGRGSKMNSFLISRSRQNKLSYHILMSWLRLNIMDPEQEQDCE